MEKNGRGCRQQRLWPLPLIAFEVHEEEELPAPEAQLVPLRLVAKIVQRHTHRPGRWSMGLVGIRVRVTQLKYVVLLPVDPIIRTMGVNLRAWQASSSSKQQASNHPK